MDALRVAIGKHTKGDKLLMSDLVALLKHVHKPGDAKLPTKVDELKTLWEERKDRLSDIVLL